ncbi:hypothetical protein [Nocardia callitridis]|uniref:Uncharacterized protein n=1 Tax=Nocardia callitridis TaxID=648753 RepID=A0ABP9K302_9NOCA
MNTHADTAQARVFFDLLVARADEIPVLLSALATDQPHGASEPAAESAHLRGELYEILRCLAKLRRRFPALDAAPRPLPMPVG